MATIEARGPDRFRVKIRVRGKSLSKTFETRREAADWARVQEGRILGNEFCDRGLAERTSLADAIAWYRDHGVDHSQADAKNKLSKLKTWESSEFAHWALVSIHAWDLIEWRKRVLDDAHSKRKGMPGPAANVKPGTVVHRLNVLSDIYTKWSHAHRVELVNPVGKDVRPKVKNGRKRRLHMDEEKRLLEAAEESSRPWLKAAIEIALETAMRQAEQTDLIWGRVHLDEEFAYVYLPETKNGEEREVPLSTRAIAVFRSLLPAGGGAPEPNAKVFPVMTPRAVAHAFDAIANDKDFPDLRWHDLRHEAISRIFETTNMRDSDIMNMTGHLRAEMLRRYKHLRTRRLAAQLK
jgi:Site-specific recombinase XerD